MLAVLGGGAEESSRVVEVCGERQKVLIADASGDIAAKTRVGVGQVKVHGVDAAHAATDVGAEEELQAAVERTAGGEKYGAASDQRIDTGEGSAVACIQAQDRGRQSAEELGA